MKTNKKKTAYVCQSCGANFPRWLGRCSSCGEWSSLVEERVETTAPTTKVAADVRAPRLDEVQAESARRYPTGIGELDRALGGGPVAGGVILLGGDPGIGKSTLLMQALGALCRTGHEALYVTGEESAAQVALRAKRIGGEGIEKVRILATNALEEAEAAIEALGVTVAVVDSIQTLRAAELTSPMGSVGQLREATSRLIEIAKRRHIALFLIGHVTKEGAIAGPKVLEHLVDTVLSFEGDRAHAFRMVRATKNRFGPAQEVGVFEMIREGLREVPDPSALFLAERPSHASGSLVSPTAEGTRPLLVEVQALVSPAAYGSARRVASGLDGNRLAILLAVLERKAGLLLADHDVFASIAGGVRVDERSIDLALSIAIASSFRNVPAPPELAVFGEVGLAGEVRAVPRPGPRVAEAKKLGFKRVVLPMLSAEQLSAEERRGVELVPVRSIGEAIDASLTR
ncbi:MAG: DNA repair protein RadA [Myxococcales bacterium]|nr:DNA repair protein RadA [Myxococcales bacterium]